MFAAGNLSFLLHQWPSHHFLGTLKVTLCGQYEPQWGAWKECTLGQAQCLLQSARQWAWHLTLVPYVPFSHLKPRFPIPSPASIPVCSSQHTYNCTSPPPISNTMNTAVSSDKSTRWIERQYFWSWQTRS